MSKVLGGDTGRRGHRRQPGPRSAIHSTPQGGGVLSQCGPSGPQPCAPREWGKQSHAHLGKLRLKQRLDLTSTAPHPCTAPGSGKRTFPHLISVCPGREGGQEDDHCPR